MTGALAVYTGAQQKARDTERMNDIEIFSTAISNNYEVATEHLPANEKVVKTLQERGFLGKAPLDPKEGEKTNGTTLGYYYGVADAEDGTHGQYFEVSTGLESPRSVGEQKETGKDGGNDSKRFEMGNGIKKVNTDVSDDEKPRIGVNTYKGATGVRAIKIKGDFIPQAKSSKFK